MYANQLKLFLARLLLSLIILLGRMPKPYLPFLAEILAWILFYLARKDGRRIRSNIKRTYSQSSESLFSKSMVRQVIRHQVFMTLELIHEISKPKSISFCGEGDYKRLVDNYTDQGKGLIIVTGHIGCWELVAHAGANISGSFNALAKPAGADFVTSFLESMRNRLGIQVLWTNKASLGRDMLGALKKNELLGFVMDQKPDLRIGHHVSFLGQKTLFVSGPARVALKSQVPILAVYCIRLGSFRYRLVCDEILYNESIGEEGLTQVLADSIGKMVKTYPEQWLWNYKRW